MVQQVERICSELQILLTPYRKVLKQRTIHLVVAWSVDVVLHGAEQSNRRCLICNGRLKLHRNSIWIYRSHRMRGIGDHFTRQRIAEGAWIEIVFLRLNLCWAGCEAWVRRVRFSTTDKWTTHWVCSSSSACGCADVGTHREWSACLGCVGEARRPATHDLIEP